MQGHFSAVFSGFLEVRAEIFRISMVGEMVGDSEYVGVGRVVGNELSTTMG